MWPKEVIIGTKVGTGSYDEANGGPCCAVGHAAFSEVPLSAFRRAYTRVYITRFPSQSLYHSVESMNDHTETRRDRNLLYNATIAYLGYTEGQGPMAIALAKKTEEAFGPCEV